MADDAGGVAAQQVIGDAGFMGFEQDQVGRDLVGERQYFLVDLAEPHRASDFAGADVKARGHGLELFPGLGRGQLFVAAFQILGNDRRRRRYDVQQMEVGIVRPGDVARRLEQPVRRRFVFEVDGDDYPAENELISPHRYGRQGGVPFQAPA